MFFRRKVFFRRRSIIDSRRVAIRRAGRRSLGWNWIVNRRCNWLESRRASLARPEGADKERLGQRRRTTRRRERVRAPSGLPIQFRIRVWETREEKERGPLLKQARAATRQEEFHALRSERLYPRDYLQLIRPCCLLSRSSIDLPIALPGSPSLSSSPPSLLLCTYIRNEEEENLADETRMCAIYLFFSLCLSPSSGSLFFPTPLVRPPGHCSRGKPIAGNTSLGSDRKEGR